MRRRLAGAAVGSAYAEPGEFGTASWALVRLGWIGAAAAACALAGLGLFGTVVWVALGWAGFVGAAGSMVAGAGLPQISQ
jgi:hypothetical protein